MIEEQVLAHYDELSATDWTVWQYVWTHREAVLRQSITQIAENAGVSPGAVTRFMQKIGLYGFADFKMTLRYQNRQRDIVPLNVRKRLGYCYDETIKALINLDFSPLFEILDAAGRVYAYGTGEVQRHAAEEFKRQFMYIACRPVLTVKGTQELDTVLGLMRPHDVLVLISMSGENARCNACARSAKENGLAVIALTGGTDNSLAAMSDFNVPFTYLRLIKSADGRHDHHLMSALFLTIEFMLTEYLQYLQAKADL